MAGRQVVAAGTRPATPLRLALQAKGWSYARLIAALRQAAARRGKQLPKSESLVVMISRWVNGRERPDAFYQELLCEALERLPSELGFKEGPGSLMASAAAQAEPWGLADPVPASPVAGGGAPSQLHASPSPFSRSAANEFLAWVAERSPLSYADAYQAVAACVQRLRALNPADWQERAYRRARVSRQQVADALAAYYQPSLRPEEGRFYAAWVGGRTVRLSVLVQPGWLQAAVQLGTDGEEVQLAAAPGDPVPVLSGPGLEAALRRLAEAEVTGTVLVNTPLYRLLDVAVTPGSLAATVASTDFVSYALTMDLLEGELIDALASRPPAAGAGAGGRGLRLPLRDRYLPTAAAALAFPERLCAGGPLALLAAARGRSGHRAQRDYVLLVQERSPRVLNAAGRLAVVPKSFHEPMVDPLEEARLSASLERELEEELLGRQDLEDPAGNRAADPFHPARLSAPMRWLRERRHGDGYRVECVSFGINMVSGNYEFACLIVVDDEEWWGRYGGCVEANWEARRIRRYSSRDAASLKALITDPRWSNEGLFAFLEGLRRLQAHDPSRLALPSIGVEG